MTDHKPHLALIHPSRPTPALVSNCLAQWVLFLEEFQYTIEYFRIKEHQNANVLSRLPSGQDPIFDEEEKSEAAYADILCAIEALSLQINRTDPAIVKTETSKDLGLVRVMRFICKGWPLPLDSNQ